MRTIERCEGLKIKLLGRVLETIKRKIFVFKDLFRSRLNYGIDPLIKNNSKYQAKWEFMLYRISKSLLGIKFNVKKSDLLNYMCTKDKSVTEFINHLFPSAFKLKLGCLFNKFLKEKICKCKKKSFDHWLHKI